MTKINIRMATIGNLYRFFTFFNFIFKVITMMTQTQTTHSNLKYSLPNSRELIIKHYDGYYKDTYDLQIFCENHLIASIKKKDLENYLKKMEIMNSEDFVFSPTDQFEVLTNSYLEYTKLLRTVRCEFSHPNEGEWCSAFRVFLHSKYAHVIHIADKYTTEQYNTPQATKIVKNGEKIKTDVGIFTIKNLHSNVYIILNDNNQYSDGFRWFNLSS